MNWDMIVHMVTYLAGDCPSCNKYCEVLSHDYGKCTYREYDAALDHTSHEIKPIPCSRCSYEYTPQYLVVKELLKKKEILRQKITSNIMISSEESEVLHAAHNRRHELFAVEGEVFWAAYISFALEDWPASVNELLKTEITTAYVKMGINIPDMRTDQQARRDVFNRLKTDADRAEFWRLANREFVEDELLDIGAMGWEPGMIAKRYGMRRTQFAIMHFPIDPALELQRTRAMGLVFRHNKGDNAILLRRIAIQTKQLEDAHNQSTAKQRQIETLKAELGKAQNKLSQSYATIRDLQDRLFAATASTPETKDKLKIRELKSFITELMAELRELRELRTTDDEKDLTQPVPAQLTEITEDAQQPDRLERSMLEGKTVAILGGHRSPGQEYPCQIITHAGDRIDPDFLAALREANYIVVLTRFISHAAMWEAKAYAISNDVPIVYCTEINIERILDAIVQKKGDSKASHAT